MVKRLRDTRDGTVYGWNRHMEAEPYFETFDDESGQTLEKEADIIRRQQEDERAAADPDQHPDIQRNALANSNVPPDPGRNYEHQVGAAALGEGEGHIDYPEAEENIVPHQKVFTAVVDRAEVDRDDEGTETGSVDEKRPRVQGRTVPNQRVKAGLLEAAEQVKENPVTDPEQGGGDQPVGLDPSGKALLPQPEKPANIVEAEEGQEVPNQGVALVIAPNPKDKPAPEPGSGDTGPAPAPAPEPSTDAPSGEEGEPVEEVARAEEAPRRRGRPKKG
jgi:hypothetical protein